MVINQLQDNSVCVILQPFLYEGWLAFTLFRSVSTDNKIINVLNMKQLLK